MLNEKEYSGKTKKKKRKKKKKAPDKTSITRLQRRGKNVTRLGKNYDLQVTQTRE